MTPQELAAQLAPIRVPAEFARFDLQDALCALSIGLVAGLIIARALRLISQPAPDPGEDLRAEIAALGAKGHQERLAGLAAILHRNGAPLPAGLERALYDPNATFDPAIAESAALRGIGTGQAP